MKQVATITAACAEYRQRGGVRDFPFNCEELVQDLEHTPNHPTNYFEVEHSLVAQSVIGRKNRLWEKMG